jgi:putative Mn2+ efflux pump MntP
MSRLFDHWLAFAILGAIGVKMIWDSFQRDEDEERPQRHSFAVLALTALGTSIDALAVGVSSPLSTPISW